MKRWNVLIAACGGGMETGDIVVAVNAAPYWRQEGSKRTLSDTVTGKGLLPFRHSLMENALSGHYCPSCKKIILDAEPA
jgi:hypothetical protein